MYSSLSLSFLSICLCCLYFVGQVMFSHDPHQFCEVSVWSGRPEGFESNTVGQNSQWITLCYEWSGWEQSFCPPSWTAQDPVNQPEIDQKIIKSSWHWALLSALWCFQVRSPILQALFPPLSPKIHPQRRFHLEFDTFCRSFTDRKALPIEADTCNDNALPM